ncbi:hypothetical protein MAMP_00254 [Methylophaga aminisulfidivorans MP]|uniref:site-specific DNA-methyltransferase (adenine-specific) n=1 Tax=Methylophaga aminisulfidivorans MP TaxID=1026882 RepID=F5T1I0_9GAMM|nr:BREX-1 system adenine-specific DNA-methyltransferase PglX [Methylophaga aminisulfidivorans]EGL53076.1 hypothetical protein MAMP_00254 [Methylophaga aminisulfidivorans MP]
METGKLKKFAQQARRSLIEQITAKLKLVLAGESAARREASEAVGRLEVAIDTQGKEQVIERVAYIWFNRFCALRFMDVNRYTRIGVVSPSEGQSQPEILAEAKMGHIDDDVVSDATRQQVSALLSGKSTSHDPQGEAYRLLVVAACNYWNQAMPFLFERIDDYTELLMPDDLLSDNSILEQTRQAMTEEVCQDVEVIGWLYQFYISEKKDLVFEGLKKNKKVTPENIPAATQLFTPHWIVRYLVENSLGRLWLLNRPHSKLAEEMDYFIKPQEPETDFLKINSPEDIKICDPACGSGHMLTYAFDLLYAIYEEEGYQPSDIPEKILTHNLFGIEIDERAGELAAFALTMKARAKQRRFFSKGIKPKICVLENIHFEEQELDEYIDFIGRDLFNAPLQTTLRQFEEADNFGSLIRPDVTEVDGMLRILESKNVSGQLFISMTHQKVLQALRQADYLSPKYHVVLANPPYMGGKGMNGRLGAWLKDNYEDVKSDLFSAFIVRNTEMTLPKGQLGFMSPFTWMFITTYEKLRDFLINSRTITSLVQLEYSGFDGATVPICTFTVENAHHPKFKGGYVRLSDFRGSENQGSRALEAIKNPGCGWFYRASAATFQKIPSSPIAYWATESQIRMFETCPSLSEVAKIAEGTTTGDVNRFLKMWHEVSNLKIGFGFKESQSAADSEFKWFPYNKGGEYRKWYGNNEFLVNWENNGQALKSYGGSFIRGEKYYFLPGVTWSKVSSGALSFRFFSEGFLFDTGGLCLFSEKISYCLSILNSKASLAIMKLLAPTLNFTVGTVSSIPVLQSVSGVESLSSTLIEHAKSDWDSYETSWDFTSIPLLNPDYRQPTLKATYQKLRAHWREMTLEMQRLEQENNRIFIEAYGLQDELTPEVPLNEITLTCNPHYCYGKDKSEGELEALLRADTMHELVSYAVGCMFGRYALDMPGLILANQGETIEDYYEKIIDHKKQESHEKKGKENFRDFRAFRGSCLFPADEDNVIPMLDGDWFTDDIVDRFREFLHVAFGDEHYEENLKFVEYALGKDIRKYFLKDFYNDHVKRYKKRPIYWLFSSPKGSFNALVYMHRYRPDTVSVVLNDYLREFRTKLTSQKTHLEAISISASASQSEKTKALKDIENLSKMIAELEEYERDVLYPLATEQVEIDLDDGVKVNYPKFGQALKKVTGLS